MTQFTKRLLAFVLAIACFATATFALSQVVSYKPWGVPDSKREQYEQTLSELTRQAELREQRKGRPTPRLRITPPRIDLGWVAPGETLEHAVRIENEGDASLQLTVRSEGHAGLTAELMERTLAPAEHTRCLVRLNVPDGTATGVQQPSFTLLTNDPNQTAAAITLVYRLKQDFIVPQQIKLGSHDIFESVSFNFDVYSQLADSLEVKQLSCDGFDVDWVAEPVALQEGELAASSATAANSLTVRLKSRDYGSYSGTLRLLASVGGEQREVRVPFSGRTKPPIGFYGPSVDVRTGVDFGALETGKRHDLYVTVRSRADKSRPIEVLGVEPRELETELTGTGTEGTYRLRISIPADCPDLRFNLDQKRGYVEIGDPNSETYSSWLPVYGAVSSTSRK